MRLPMGFKFAQEEFLAFEDILKDSLQAEKAVISEGSAPAYKNFLYKLESKIAKLFQAFNPIFLTDWQIFAANINNIFELIIKYIGQERSNKLPGAKPKNYKKSAVEELVHTWLLLGQPFIFFSLAAYKDLTLVEKAYRAAVAPHIATIMQALESFETKLELELITTQPVSGLQEIISLIKEIKRNINSEFSKEPIAVLQPPALLLDQGSADLIIRRALLSSPYAHFTEGSSDLEKEPLSPTGQNEPKPSNVSPPVKKIIASKDFSNSNAFSYWVASAIIEGVLAIALTAAAVYATFSRFFANKLKPIIIYSYLGAAISLIIAAIATVCYAVNTRREEILSQPSFSLYKIEPMLTKERQLC